MVFRVLQDIHTDILCPMPGSAHISGRIGRAGILRGTGLPLQQMPACV